MSLQNLFKHVQLETIKVKPIVSANKDFRSIMEASLNRDSSLENIKDGIDDFHLKYYEVAYSNTIDASGLIQMTSLIDCMTNLMMMAHSDRRGDRISARNYGVASIKDLVKYRLCTDQLTDFKEGFQSVVREFDMGGFIPNGN